MDLKNLVQKYNLKIKGVLHIGGHFGEEYDVYRDLMIENMIFFEPVKSNFEKLTATVPYDVLCYNIALGNESTSKLMYIEHANQGQSCSILEPAKHLEQYPLITFDSTEVVEMYKLDNVYFARSLFNMINMDVQGFELEVLKGAVETLKGIDIIYTEVNRDEVYKNCARVEQLDEFLSDFERIETDWSGTSWGDSLYIRK